MSFQRVSHSLLMDMGGTPSRESNPLLSDRPTPVVECRPVYVPFESLTQPVIRSMISVVYQHGRETWDFSQRTVLSYLLAVHEKLEQVLKESSTDEHAIEVRSWLVDDHNAPLDWEKLQCLYAEQKRKHFDRMADYFGADSCEPYFQLTMATVSTFPSLSHLRHHRCPHLAIRGSDSVS